MSLHHTGVPAPFFTCRASLCFWLCSHHRVLPCLCSPKCVDTHFRSPALWCKAGCASRIFPGHPWGLSGQPLTGSLQNVLLEPAPPPPPRGLSWPASPAPSCLVSGHPRTQCQPRTAQLCLQLCALMQITQPPVPHSPHPESGSKHGTCFRGSA